jgi:hypothetical protein
MNRYSIWIILFVLVACKSTQKLMDSGRYTEAFYSAIEDWKKKPDDETIRRQLSEAYDRSAAQLLAGINSAKAASGRRMGDRLDQAYANYKTLQELYDAGQGIPSLTVKDYSAPFDSAAREAASYHYEAGMVLMGRGPSRQDAREALTHFRRADAYVPGYKDVVQQLSAAEDLSVTHVVVRQFDQRFGRYSVNGAFFEGEVLWNLNTLGNYVKFYGARDPSTRDVRPDQYMDILLSDIWFGRMFTNSYSYTVSKTLPADPRLKIAPEKVSATVFVTRRGIEARATMDCRITTAGGQPVSSDRFPARYAWENLTGRYTGDSRALSEKDWAIIRGAFNQPPSYDELYRNLTRQIMNDFLFRMRGIYR